MAAARGRAGVGSELDEALVRAGRYLRKGVVSADLRTLQKSGGREADSFYRDRWSYDKVVRSTHGVNCTGSCSWKVYVKDGIITWEAQQTDYPSPARLRAAGVPARRGVLLAHLLADPVPLSLRARRAA
jgi:nitrate reductase alpha subunit